MSHFLPLLGLFLLGVLVNLGFSIYYIFFRGSTSEISNKIFFDCHFCIFLLRLILELGGFKINIFNLIIFHIIIDIIL